MEIMQLDLRFIALRIREGSIPASISDFHYLETLIVRFVQQVLGVPKNIWKMRHLRHLVLQDRFPVDFEDPCFEEAEESYEVLENLETIKSLNPSSKFNDQILERTPNLRKLGFCGKLLLQSSKYLMLPNLGKLNRLQKLKLVYTDINIWKSCTFSSSIFFPATLKKLTLKTTLNFSSSQIDRSCVCRLKFLELHRLEIWQWNASSEQFPNLRHLKLEICYRLEQIPLGLGDIYPLEMLEVRLCSAGVEKSAYKIKEVQESKGNDLLKVSISHTEF